MRSMCMGGAAIIALLAPAAAQAAWSKSYVVEWYEPAFYYGAAATGGGETVGTDCPGGINPANDWKKILTTSYRSETEAGKLLDPDADRQAMYRQFPIRGPNKENVYLNPTAVPDPGMIEVAGKTAYGFNLDGDETTGFTGPKGEKGVDNAYYKVSGCILRFRGPPRGAAGFKYSNDGMRDGVYTMVLVARGEGDDPRNDPNATLGLYVSKDKVVKDANSGLARDYSYRVEPDARFQSVVPVTVKDGVIESKDATDIQVRDFWTPGFFPEELKLQKARIRLETKSDGTLSGYFGGYRDWREHYRGTRGGDGDGASNAGAIHENIGRMNLVAWWYALRRAADGMPDPKTGENMGISSTYRIDALPAFVVMPKAGQRVASTTP